METTINEKINIRSHTVASENRFKRAYRWFFVRIKEYKEQPYFYENSRVNKGIRNKEERFKDKI